MERFKLKVENESKIEGLVIREIIQGEEGILLQLIKEMSIYEKMEDCVVATKEGLYNALFEQHACKCMLVEFEEKIIGFCLYFYTFSTFCGRTNMYLEEIFLQESYRGRGFGKEVFRVLVNKALSEGCHRFEWVCLDWNKPSIEFYKKIGAFTMDGWSTWRMTKKEMEAYVR